MYQIEQPEPTDEFKKAWISAGRHIQNQADTGFMWLRADLNRPFAEHLSFRIGNQIFFIFVEAAEFNYKKNGKLFDRMCKEANAIPCIMPMTQSFGSWRPHYNGWGLINAELNVAMNPLTFVTDELIEMTDWELFDFAIQVVCAEITKQGKKILSKQSSQEIDPTIWYQDETGTNYIVVRAARHPETNISLPKNIRDVMQACSKEAENGYFASVIFANSDDPVDPDAKSNGNFLPLYRGHAVFPNYSGLSVL